MAKPKPDTELATYNAKRRFDHTPEPQGKLRKTGKVLRFVVQKHAASRLHYDFRLEVGGVLKSWAVPKGPSLDPSDKRLAMMVEDHPLDYRDFEGIIPKGNYGGGTVMVWDQGTYWAMNDHWQPASDREIRAAIHKGHLTFVLDGQKLSGEFALVKLHNTDEENAWLLIKADKDKFVSRQDITKQDRSVLSQRSLDEIAAQADRQWSSNRAQKTAQPRASSQSIDLATMHKQKFPGFIAPMLATLSKDTHDEPDWLYEIKWDGYRIIACLKDNKVKLYTRNQQDYTQRYAAAAQDLIQIKHTAVLDGEMVVIEAEGKSKFQLLQDYQQTGQGHLVYYVFDIMHLDGHDVTSLPLASRKELLASLVPELPHVKISDHITGQGKAFFELARQRGLEGVMAKAAQSRYAKGKRSPQWLKIKTHQRQEAVIAGYTEPRGGRKYLGALVLGVYKDDKLIYIGHTGGGFNDRKLKDLFDKLRQIEISDCPFAHQPKTNAPAHWVKPELVCEVEFSEWTSDGHMRQPIFVGLREDKPAREVVQEMPQPAQSKRPSAKTSPSASRKTKGDSEVTIKGNKLILTHLDKVYWPQEGYTKGDVTSYYQRMAKFIMPYLKDRPMSLNRHPNGIEGESFYQKDFDKAPAWASLQSVHSDSEERDIHYLVCTNETALVYMANLGCIEINPWSSRTSSLDKPDWCIIDLDPEDIGFDKVIEAARAVHEVLEAAKIPHYPKTSGATGIHIYIPLGAKYDYEQSKDFAHIIAQLVHARIPDFTSLERSPAKRPHKIYLDYLQNRRGQTLAAAYSVRPKPGATVSTPLQWEEVKPGLHPSQFTIKTIENRVKQVGDLWKPVNGKGIDMVKALKSLGS